jgi:hypothetical protein
VTDPDLPAFIRSSIRSVWALEVLLLLKRQPDRAWTPEDLVRELRASTTVVADALAAFSVAGLVRAEEGAYAYGPASPVLGRLCEALDRTYRERPVAVINAIASPRDRMQSFADAFRLKDDPK